MMFMRLFEFFVKYAIIVLLEVLPDISQDPWKRRPAQSQDRALLRLDPNRQGSRYMFDQSQFSEMVAFLQLSDQNQLLLLVLFRVLQTLYQSILDYVEKFTFFSLFHYEIILIKLKECQSINKFKFFVPI